MTLAVCYFTAAAAMAALFLLGDPSSTREVVLVWVIVALIGLVVWGVTLQVVAWVL